MGSFLSRSVRSVLVLSALAVASACSDAAGGISGVEPGGAALAAKPGRTSPGDVTATSYYCSGVAGFIGYQIAPYCTGGPFGGFQSTSGTGYQSSITITFANTVSSVTVTALDPDYSGNYMYAYGASNNYIGHVEFGYDNAPGSYTESTRTIYGSGIKYVVLVPSTYDYVAYSNTIGFN